MVSVKRCLLQLLGVAVICELPYIGWDLTVNGRLPPGGHILIWGLFWLVPFSPMAILRNRGIVHGPMVIRYRVTVLQSAFLPIAYLWGMTAAIAAIDWYKKLPFTAPETRDFVFQALVGSMLLLALTIVMRITEDVTLTPWTVTVRNFRTHMIHWRDVTNVSVEKQFGCRIVAIWDTRGRRIRLRAPYSFLDGNFDEKLQVIRACWLGHYDWSNLR